jgi:hypothetical protein
MYLLYAAAMIKFLGLVLILMTFCWEEKEKCRREKEAEFLSKLEKVSLKDLVNDELGW